MTIRIISKIRSDPTNLFFLGFPVALVFGLRYQWGVIYTLVMGIVFSLIGMVACVIVEPFICSMQINSRPFETRLSILLLATVCAFYYYGHITGPSDQDHDGRIDKGSYVCSVCGWKSDTIRYRAYNLMCRVKESEVIIEFSPEGSVAISRNLERYDNNTHAWTISGKVISKPGTWEVTINDEPDDSDDSD